MKTLYLDDRELDYDGSFLRSHWIREISGLEGDACVAFAGACDVQPEHVVDMEERLSKEAIRAARMLHVIGEQFGRFDTAHAALVGRHASAVMADVLGDLGAEGIHRKGDDLFALDGKLSVSIATVSPVSLCWHMGLNIDGAGAPVKVCTLEQLGVKSGDVAKRFLDAWADECRGIADASVKVRPVP